MQFNKKKSSQTVTPLKNGEWLKFDDFPVSHGLLDTVFHSRLEY